MDSLLATKTDYCESDSSLAGTNTLLTKTDHCRLAQLFPERWSLSDRFFCPVTRSRFLQ